MSFWVRKIASSILERKGKKNVVATGITPSGPFHLGHLREMVTGEVIFRSLQKKGASSKLIYIADDFDPLRRLYPSLPKKFEKYIGRPLFLIPDLWGCCNSYAEHFLKPFLVSLEGLGISPQIYYASAMYKKGLYKPLIREALQKKEAIKKIIEKISRRKLPAKWFPYHPLCKKCLRLTQTKIKEINLKKEYVSYKCDCGYSGKANFKGEGKLPWRIDWPARWKILKVTVEPMGKDMAVAGGAFATGKEISKEIFNYSSPYPIFYEWIHLKGKGAMASSTGVVIAIEDMQKILPSEALRYLILRSHPSRHLDFDPAEGLLNLIEEYNDLAKNYQVKKGKITQKELYQASLIPRQKYKIGIDFSHLAYAIQAANYDFEEIVRILSRSGHLGKTYDKKFLSQQIERATEWLKNFAPPRYKFSIQKRLPKISPKLNKKQKELLKNLASLLEKRSFKPEGLHNEIYNLGKKLKLSPSETFAPIYLSLLGQGFGPKAGWFLSLLDKKFVIKRFKEASK